MKKILLLVIMVISLFTITACTYSESHNLAVIYDFDNRKCNITNISEVTDYEKLKVTIVLEANNNFSKEIVCDVGALERGETYTDDLSYISEDLEVNKVYIKSYEYYENEIFKIFALGVFVVFLIFIGVIFT